MFRKVKTNRYTKNSSESFGELKYNKDDTANFLKIEILKANNRMTKITNSMNATKSWLGVMKRKLVNTEKWIRNNLDTMTIGLIPEVRIPEEERE